MLSSCYQRGFVWQSHVVLGLFSRGQQDIFHFSVTRKEIFQNYIWVFAHFLCLLMTQMYFVQGGFENLVNKVEADLKSNESL